MYLEIITPDSVLFDGEIISAKFPGNSGEFETLDKHAAVISSLEKGTIFVKTSEGNHEFEVQGGIVEVLDNKIKVLA